jgi:Ca2+-binding EF-hand superfamily protein
MMDFMNFREKLKLALRHYEFHTYEMQGENETISAEDFAKSLLVYLPQTQTARYLKRIHQIKLEGEITFKQFLAFQHFIDDVDNIKEKVIAYRYINLDQLKALAKEFCAENKYCKKDKDMKITEVQIETMVKLLDLDDNGQLDQDEVIGILEERMMLGQGREAEIKEAINTTVEKGLKWIKQTLKI